MNSIVVAGTSLACAFGGVLFGMVARRLIPEAHLDEPSKDGIKLGTGIIATMAALVLGLLIGGAKSSFDAQSASLQQLAGNIMFLDRNLAHYGSEASDVRGKLRDLATALGDRIWPPNNAPDAAPTAAAVAGKGQALFNAIRALVPADDVQRDAQRHALEMNVEMTRARWLIAHRDYDTLPLPLVVVLQFWFFVIFSSLGTFWARNSTVVIMFFVCAISVASATFLIVDLDQPYEGLIQVSRDTLNDAVSQIGK